MVLREPGLQVVLDQHEVALLHVERLEVFGGEQLGRSALVGREQVLVLRRVGSRAH